MAVYVSAGCEQVLAWVGVGRGRLFLGDVAVFFDCPDYLSICTVWSVGLGNRRYREQA